MSISRIKWIASVVVVFCLLNQINGSTISGGSTCCEDNSVLVNGVGRVSIQPDIAFITVGATVTAKTSQAAVQGVAIKIAQIIAVLKKYNISDADIKTQSINIYPQYDYPNGVQTLVGQTASQFLVAKVKKIDKNGGNLGKIIDQLSAIDKVQFGGLRFDKENKEAAQKQARKIAFNDAKKKAVDLASLSGRKLGIALNIVDSTGEASSTIPLQEKSFAAAGASTQVPVGEIEINYYVTVKFALV